MHHTKDEAAVGNESELLSRNAITSASADGVSAEVNGEKSFRSWDCVTSVGATIVPQGDANIFVLAVVFDDMRTFVAGESEAVWPQMLDHLHASLPGIEPFSSWGPKLVAEPGAVALFDRDG
jgi:hypothetical protein